MGCLLRVSCTYPDCSQQYPILCDYQQIDDLLPAPIYRSKAALKMFGETLAKEERDVTTVSIRPGVVDTEMQAVIREKGE